MTARSCPRSCSRTSRPAGASLPDSRPRKRCGCSSTIRGSWRSSGRSCRRSRARAPAARRSSRAPCCWTRRLRSTPASSPTRARSARRRCWRAARLRSRPSPKRVSACCSAVAVSRRERLSRRCASPVSAMASRRFGMWSMRTSRVIPWEAGRSDTAARHFSRMALRWERRNSASCDGEKSGTAAALVRDSFRPGVGPGDMQQQVSCPPAGASAEGPAPLRAPGCSGPRTRRRYARRSPA